MEVVGSNVSASQEAEMSALFSFMSPDNAEIAKRLIREGYAIEGVISACLKVRCENEGVDEISAAYLKAVDEMNKVDLI